MTGKLTGAAPSRVSIYDPAGRLVRTLAVPVGGAGTSAAFPVVWDARDGHGVHVPAGTYLCRVDGGMPGGGVKITIVR